MSKSQYQQMETISKSGLTKTTNAMINNTDYHSFFNCSIGQYAYLIVL